MRLILLLLILIAIVLLMLRLPMCSPGKPIAAVYVDQPVHS